jgi:hypothetical protein
MSDPNSTPDIPPGATGIPGKPDRRAELMGVSIALTTWAAIFVVARLYVRIFKTKSFGWDDGFIALACVRTLQALQRMCD